MHGTNSRKSAGWISYYGLPNGILNPCYRRVSQPNWGNSLKLKGTGGPLTLNPSRLALLDGTHCMHRSSHARLAIRIRFRLPNSLSMSDLAWMRQLRPSFHASEIYHSLRPPTGDVVVLN